MFWKAIQRGGSKGPICGSVRDEAGESLVGKYDVVCTNGSGENVFIVTTPEHVVGNRF